MFDVIKERLGGVDVCINNAGLAMGPSIIEGDSEEWENMWQVKGRGVALHVRKHSHAIYGDFCQQ